MLVAATLPPTGFWAEVVRDTLLGACLGVVPLALLLAIQRLVAWREGDPDGGLDAMLWVGSAFLALPIIFIIWPISAVNPRDWKTLMFTAGLLLIGAASFIYARRFAQSLKKDRRHRKGA